MLTKEQYNNYFYKGISFDEYFKIMQRKAVGEIPDEKVEYIPLNLQRTQRNIRQYISSEIWHSAIHQISGKQYWLLITEHWCGDSAQITPVIFKMAEQAGDKIELRILMRDENLEIMDAHLTKGSRSIPKLIILDEEFRVIGEWGPRPEEAMQVVKEAKANPETAGNYSEYLHKWYATNRQVDIIKELSATVLNSIHTSVS